MPKFTDPIKFIITGKGKNDKKTQKLLDDLKKEVEKKDVNR